MADEVPSPKGWTGRASSVGPVGATINLVRVEAHFTGTPCACASRFAVLRPVEQEHDGAK
ncbi:hypothetical protein GCM10010406_48280 [Streptomyces thermolineatus]|uniref:Uncharacterized protein n=1 Tax=Streptomyces thermolineatus TaxID=44033 RepID=A0ABN3MPL1_9ACTN